MLAIRTNNSNYLEIKRQYKGIIMQKIMINFLKAMTLLTTLIIAVIAILYVLDYFSDEYIKELVVKVLKIMAIITGVSFVTILLTNNREK